tara:strand:- start:76 stop:984 length:909 start_codon:yes stop_codon:yes gene_type:complete
MNNLDLDINNYELTDILNLFSISSDFTETDLKMCKRQVLMTHPDKSRLSKEYFLFFSRAYKILYEIYKFKQNNNANLDIEYEAVLKNIVEAEASDNEQHKNIKKFATSDEFNAKFNRLFEKHHVKTDHDSKGYGEFLSSKIQDEAVLNLSNGTIPQTERGQCLEGIRAKTRELVVHQDIKTADTYAGHTNIDAGAPSQYSSEIFSSLPYEDLKKAHTETLIAVTHEDARKEQFSSINDLKQHRSADIVRPPSLQQANRFLAEQASLDELDTTTRAYRLARQSEQAHKMQQEFNSHFNRLTNY